MRRISLKTSKEISAIINPKDIMEIREVVRTIYIDEKIEKYIIDIVNATRYPEKYNMPEYKRLIEYGASPRASISLVLAAKAHAFIRKRGFVTPEDIKSIGHDVLRHRIGISYEAEAEEITSDDIITKIFNTIEVP